MIRFRFSLAIVAILSTVPALAQDKASARYDILIAGVKVGGAAMNALLSPTAYEASVTVRLQGMAKLVASGLGSATASGALGGAMVQPSSYALNLKLSDKSEQIDMRMAGGAVSSLSVDPERPALPDQIALTSSHKAGIIDPLSGGLFMSREPSAALNQDACAKNFPIFDGRQRYDIAFGFSRKDSLKAAGYSGPVLVCSARYKPIAGHSPSQTAYMANNREMEVWLVPVAGTKVFMPGRIKIRTPVGLAMIEPTKIDFGTAPASAQ